MEKWRQCIHYGLRIFYSATVSFGKVCDHLSAERYESGNFVGINTIQVQARFIQTNHCRQISSGRMSRYKNAVRVASVFLNVFENPRHSCCSIVYAVVYLYFRCQAVVYAHHANVLVSQGSRQFLFTTRQTSSVKPNNDCNSGCFFRIINVEFTAVGNVFVLPADFFGIIGNVLYGTISLFCCNDTSCSENKYRENDDCYSK